MMSDPPSIQHEASKLIDVVVNSTVHLMQDLLNHLEVEEVPGRDLLSTG